MTTQKIVNEMTEEELNELMDYDTKMRIFPLGMTRVYKMGFVPTQTIMNVTDKDYKKLQSFKKTLLKLSLFLEMWYFSKITSSIGNEECAVDTVKRTSKVWKYYYAIKIFINVLKEIRKAKDEW